MDKTYQTDRESEQKPKKGGLTGPQIDHCFPLLNQCEALLILKHLLLA